MNKITFEKLRSLYPEPNSEAKSVDFLVRHYETKTHLKLTDKEKESIGEYYRAYKSIGVDAFYWIVEAINRFSKKSVTKQEYGYFIGILKSWLNYGFGNSGTDETREAITEFEDILGVEMSMTSRVLLQKIIAEYGLVKFMKNISNFKLNLTDIIAEEYERYLQDRYKTRMEIYEQTFHDSPSASIDQATPQSAVKGSVSDERDKPRSEPGKSVATRNEEEYGVLDQLRDEAKLAVDYMRKRQMDNEDESEIVRTSITDLSMFMNRKGYPYSEKKMKDKMEQYKWVFGEIRNGDKDSYYLEL